MLTVKQTCPDFEGEAVRTEGSIHFQRTVRGILQGMRTVMDLVGWEREGFSVATTIQRGALGMAVFLDLP